MNGPELSDTKYVPSLRLRYTGMPEKLTVGDTAELNAVLANTSGRSYVYRSTDLPAGLTLERGSGSITGTVTAAAEAFAVTVTVTNTADRSDHDECELVFPAVKSEEEPPSLACSDLEPDAWYREAVDYVIRSGLMTGYGGRFSPNDSITREQLAVMLYRYEQRNGGGFTGSWMFLLDCSDAAQISGWSYEAVAWCTMNGIMSGYSDGTLRPAGYATRAEAAVMLMRFFSR